MNNDGILEKDHVTQKNHKLAMRVSIISIIVNVLLSAGKLVVGLIARSTALVSDAVHSASDVFSTFIVMIGITVAAKSPDKQHSYGHERLECIASILLAVVLFAVGAGIGYRGVEQIVLGQYGSAIATPGILALLMAVISIVVKEWMFWFTRAAAKKTNSGALMADAWHHRSDALSSIGSFAGILGARLGLPILDPIAALVICLFIFKAAYDIFADAVNKLVDRSCDEATEAQMSKVIRDVPGVLGVDSLQTRLFGSRIYVDIEIAADGSQSLNSAHCISTAVHDAIEREFPMVKHCMVHTNPINP